MYIVQFSPASQPFFMDSAHSFPFSILQQKLSRNIRIYHKYIYMVKVITYEFVSRQYKLIIFQNSCKLYRWMNEIKTVIHWLQEHFSVFGFHVLSQSNFFHSWIVTLITLFSDTQMLTLLVMSMVIKTNHMKFNFNDLIIWNICTCMQCSNPLR